MPGKSGLRDGRLSPCVEYAKDVKGNEALACSVIPLCVRRYFVWDGPGSPVVDS